MGIEETVAGWKALRKLRATGIDLGRVSLIRQMDVTHLSDVDRVTSLIEELGLNDEGPEEYPLELHRSCGLGLRIWQYPIQFAPYLVDLSLLGIRSYLEVGVRHGGTFVATVEYLQRFGKLERALGVDVLPCPGIVQYGRENEVAHFVRLSTQSADYARFLANLGTVDLVLIDSFHEGEERRKEIAAVLDRARIIAVHDIAHDGHPGLRAAWNELRALDRFECREYVKQYPSLDRSYMGIGLAIRRD